MSRRQLGPRTIVAYNRLAREVAAFNYLIRVAKPSSTLGEAARRSLDRTLALANRIYRREPGIRGFTRFDPIDPLTTADVILLVTRLSVAGIAFEERYAFLAEDGLKEEPQLPHNVSFLAKN